MKIGGDDVLEFFDAMVCEASHRIEQGSVDYIDLPAIQSELLPGFIHQWREPGYINDNQD